MNDLFMPDVKSVCHDIEELLERLPRGERIEAINDLREAIHRMSPFTSEPVDFVRWVKADSVHANDYNPNSVAPPEMELLRHSINEDGYTQPIVAMAEGDAHEVIDGFHRHRVGKECKDVANRVHGYLPIVQIRGDRTGKSDRMAATIRHNRARGKHKVEAMSDIVIELKRRNWSEDKIGRELGMEPDEVLRLCQITGLAEAFKDQDFSQAWEVGQETGSQELSDEAEEPDTNGSRILRHRIQQDHVAVRAHMGELLQSLAGDNARGHEGALREAVPFMACRLARQGVQRRDP